MTNLKDLNLTENDFKLLIDGLTELPNKGMAGMMMGELLGAVLMKDDSDTKSEWEKQKMIERRKQEKEKESMMDDVRILQGKLTMLKRYLEQNNLMKQVHEVLED